MQALKLPRSCSHWLDPFTIAASAVVAYLALRNSTLSNLELILAIVGAVLFVMVPLEYMRSPALRSPRPNVPLRDTIKRASIKSVGILFGLGILLLAWWIIPEYARKDYATLFEAMPYVLPFVPPAIIACVFWTEWRLGPSEDHAWHFGLLALQRYKEVNWIVIRDGLLGWVIKGFFLPLNVDASVFLINTFRGEENKILTADWPQIVNMIDHMTFALLLIAIIPGYVFSARILGTDNKKIDHTWFGWGATFFCYPPISRGAGTGWFLYELKSNVMPWIIWFGSEGPASYTVGIILIFTYIVHYWAESICCLRSSHLTNRGIITNGPFRACKHPVYVAKCIGWALSLLPFLSGKSVHQDISMTFGFLAFCCVYVMRSWVEERVLSTDPDYVAYAMWMERHSIFRFIGKHIPMMSFAWRLKRWNATGANL